MAQPFDVSNRFDILTTREEGALDQVLASFAEHSIEPSELHTLSHTDGTMAVTVVVKQLAEPIARAIHSGLKHKAFVRDARLEHFVV
ncbi:MAG: hypothetical protein EP335_07410 [Alphaproteobacteria bacterium]|nr:MAG: hypothetical protein EP335_07410 [Alphaproteobacteria bacterium]